MIELNDRQMHQWFMLISEAERREIVKGIPNCMTFGAVSMLQRLPDQAKLAVRDAYARHLKLVADLEAAHPAH